MTKDGCRLEVSEVLVAAGVELKNAPPEGERHLDIGPCLQTAKRAREEHRKRPLEDIYAGIHIGSPFLLAVCCF